MASELMSQRELADLLGVRTNTLWHWRKQGTGPAWFRFSARLVRYERAEVERWIEAQKHSSGS